MGYLARGRYLWWSVGLTISLRDGKGGDFGGFFMRCWAIWRVSGGAMHMYESRKNVKKI